MQTASNRQQRWGRWWTAGKVEDELNAWRCTRYGYKTLVGRLRVTRGVCVLYCSSVRHHLRFMIR